eukprot:PhM_4_TR9563/c0_g1_i1/m.26172/K12662/PRPF4, PRP4; U4/U6 small nuclear ribonucleoprotein PRP4
MDTHLLQRIEQQRRELYVHVPNSDADVKAKLRSLGHVATYFGETSDARRQRLRNLLVERGIYEKKALATTAASAADVTATSSSDDTVLSFRKALQVSTSAASSSRLKEEMESLHTDRRTKTRRFREIERQKTRNLLRGLVGVGSQFGSTAAGATLRCLRAMGSRVAIGDWVGDVRLWDIDTAEEVAAVPKAHDGRVLSVAWGAAADLFATGGADKVAKVWRSTSGGSRPALVHALTGAHSDAVTSVGFLPHHDSTALVTGSADASFAVWDLARAAMPVWRQRGQPGGVTALSPHCDGSLVFVADETGLLVAWDLRSGLVASTLRVHEKRILCVDSALDGHTVATGGEDNMVCIWDLRQPAAHSAALASHKGLVTDVRFAPDRRRHPFLVSASFDLTLKTWECTTGRYQLIKTLHGHDQRVYTCDVVFKDSDGGSSTPSC